MKKYKTAGELRRDDRVKANSRWRRVNQVWSLPDETTRLDFGRYSGVFQNDFVFEVQK